jgi:hypothetical protein
VRRWSVGHGALCGGGVVVRVASIWKNQSDGASDPIPDPKWVVIGPEYVTWRPMGLEKESTEEKDSKEKVRQVKEVKMSFIGDELRAAPPSSVMSSRRFTRWR